MTKRKPNKTTRKARKTTKTEKVTPAPKLYAGAPIPATKLYTKDMAKQFKGTEAAAFAAVNDKDATITYFNLYRGQLTASYRPEPYRFPFTPKTQKKLDQGWMEVDRDEWPEVVEGVPGSRTRSSPRSRGH